MTVYAENPKEFTKVTRNEFRKVQTIKSKYKNQLYVYILVKEHKKLKF